jgi:hypothetical protein
MSRNAHEGSRNFLTKISWQMERMGLNRRMGVPARFVGTPLCASRKPQKRDLS